MGLDRDRDQLIARIVAADSRYAPAAYHYIFEALRISQRRAGQQRTGRRVTVHISARQLLEGLRQLALRQFGMMAPAVLRGWGIEATADFGAIVFNLIEAGALERSPEDSPDDFQNVFDFGAAFLRDFRIELDDLV